jgi:hypothetical protein
VNYNDVMKDPVAVTRDVAAFFGGRLDAAKMADVVDPSLYRQRNAGRSS